MDALNIVTVSMNWSRNVRENNGTDGHEDFVGESMSLPFLSVLGGLHALSILNGVLGNSLLLATLCTDKPFRILSQTYGVYLVNLVLADFYILGYNFPMMIVGYFSGRYPAVNHMHCAAMAYLLAVSYHTFLLTLLLISLDRCVRVCHYDVYNSYFRKRNVVCACLLTWLTAGLIMLPGLLEGSFGFNEKVWSCTLNNVSLGRYSGWAFSLTAGSTIVGYVALNCQTYQKIRRTRQRENAAHFSLDCKRQRLWFGSDVTLLRSVLVMFVCLLLCMTPTVLVHILGSSFDLPVELYAACSLLMSVNSSVSWALCGLTNVRFRYGYKRTLSKCAKCLPLYRKR